MQAKLSVNMKKLYLFLTLLLGFHAAWGYEAEVDGISYDLNAEDMTATVINKGSHFPEDEYLGDVIIPEYVTVDKKVYTVTSLGKACFWRCSNLTSITIPHTIKSLGEGCFEDCISLTSVTIPNSVTYLGALCFYGRSSLTSATIPHTIKSLGEGCFSGCI